MRSIAFLIVFALFWVTTSPFVDLRNPDVLLAAESGNLFQQVCVVTVLGLCLAILQRRWDTAVLGISPALMGVVAFQWVSVVTSTHFDLSIRRFVLSTAVTVITLTWTLIPRDRAQFARLLMIGSFAVLALAYFGVAFLPALSIHNLDEVLELNNAGGWRGHFAHKNIAGAAMVFLIIYGLYVRVKLGLVPGALIVILASVFLYNSDNKTSIGLVVFVLLLSVLVRRAKSLWAKGGLVLIPLAAMTLFTIGSVLFEPLHAVVTTLSSDPTFTNRTDVWRFGLAKLAEHPLLGYGFDAFWATSDLINGGYGIEGWAASAGHAHNGDLNVALSMGIPGMVLVVYWLVWEPLRDYHAAQETANDPALGLMYLRIWIFGMLYACLESPFFDSRGPIWFSILGSVFGLRYHALAVQVSDRRLSTQDGDMWAPMVTQR